ncbi:peptidase T [Paenibacillus sp. CAA11]|uniref:peptidase T n=1 Tax=Paenibacillus sp. CAA11 TaxID=1532905 RepID=UPI000D3CFAE6|nr:peptidase T [Paenibacillus sp. CAA11]AWB46435.1 peptidase T [Paenibacillus sp. CAA11]
MKEELITRFVKYAKVNTQSNDDNETCPSTPGQLELANLLVDELKELGLEEVTMDEHGYVMATLPSNTDKEVPVIGFLAHLDTATEVTGEGVNPQRVESYDGGDIVLSEAHKVVLSPKEFPELGEYIGHTLITTDGTTLLGADDKAGIAEIITAMDYLIQHPEVKHGKIRVAFTPDEEIGRGPSRFDVAKFGAKYAYTMDGGPIGELEYESFNAASAKIKIKGTNVHPGTAKGKMVHSIKIAMELQHKLPASEAPEFTSGYDGFYHLLSLNGNVEETEMHYIIREFNREKFEAKKTYLCQCVDELKDAYGEERIVLNLRDEYYNMKDKIEPVKHIVDIAQQAMEDLEIKPVIKSIRGGTDGSQLSYMGMPTPNIFAGGENFHSKFEYVSADNMVKAVQVIVRIAQLFEEKDAE